MTKPLLPRLDILPPAQRRLWAELNSVAPNFVLYGGTGLALHLGHRISVDFDFFTSEAIDPPTIYRETPFLRRSTIIQQAPNTLTCLIDRKGPVKVSFFGLPHLTLLRDAHTAHGNNLRIASLLDLAATKAVAVQNRLEAKDYIDIDALISAGIALPTVLAAAKRAFGKSFAPLATLKALTYFDEGNLQSLPDDVKLRLVNAVAAVDPLMLPAIKRSVSQ
ncbi:MAG: nucleotidyl transferase AbiEii/AbiGii toxin family protein [Hyphomicrobiaceae bacterium]